jgi:hypothetical protein
VASHWESLVQLPQAWPPELLPELLPELPPEVPELLPELDPELLPVLPELLPEPLPEMFPDPLPVLPELLPLPPPLSVPASAPKSPRPWLESPEPQAATRANEKTIALTEPSFMGALPSVFTRVARCTVTSPVEPQRPSPVSAPSLPNRPG